MIDVLIVDDEPMIIEILRRTIDWKKYNMRVVGCAYDGFAAIDFLKKHDVDIVFTDVKMPHMGGLELIERLHEFLPDLLFVVISSYSDFNLVRESFKNGVEDYILKIDIDNEKVLDKLLSKLKSKVELRNPMAGSKYPTEQLLQKINHEQAYLEQCVFRMMTITLEDNVKTVLVSELLFILRENAAHFVFGFFDWKIIILCFGEDAEQVSNICDFLVQKIHSDPEADQILIVGSSNCMGYKNLNELYDQAKQSLDAGFYHPREAYFQYKNTSNREYLAAYKRLMEMTSKLMESVSIHELSNGIDHLFCIISKEETTPSLIKENLVSFFGELHRVIDKKFGSMATENLLALTGLILSATDYAELKELCSNKIYELSLKLNDQMNIPLSDAIQAYIHMHYHNPNLTIQDVADDLHVNQRSISNCFAEKMGMHFKDYLNQIRIERAKEILANSSLRINETAARVGYSSVEHFSRLFSKSVGESPIKYLKRNRP